MKRINYRSPVVMCFVILGAAWFYVKNQSPEFTVINSSIKTFSGVVDLEEAEDEGPNSENPQKRLQYEFDMLKDPTTGKIPDNIRSKEVSFSKTIKRDEADGVYIRSSAAGVAKTNAEPFISFGPVNIGGRTRALAIDVTDENIILAGGVSGGVWRTTDQGLSWTRTTDFSQIPSVTSIVQDKRAGNTSNWYYASGEDIGNSAGAVGAFYFGNGIYKSIDGGQSWGLIQNTASNSSTSLSRYSIVNKIAIDQSNLTEPEIYVAGLSEILRTTDDFETVTPVLGSSNLSGRNSTDVAVMSDGTVLAVITNELGNGSNPQEGVFISSNGIDWESIILPSSWPEVYGRVEISIDPNDENIFYTLSADFFYRYDRSTSTWTDLTSNINLNSESTEGFDPQGGYNLVSAVHPADPVHCFLRGNKLIKISKWVYSKYR